MTCCGTNQPGDQPSLNLIVDQSFKPNPPETGISGHIQYDAKASPSVSLDRLILFYLQPQLREPKGRDPLTNQAQNSTNLPSTRSRLTFAESDLPALNRRLGPSMAVCHPKSGPHPGAQGWFEM